MKVICALFGLVVIASAQAGVPEKGWKMVETGDGKTEGGRFLGGWENEAKTVLDGVVWAPKMPEVGILLGFGSGNIGVDPSDWPKGAEVRGEGRLGARFEMGFVDKKNTEREERYWMYGEKGGLLLKVLLLREAEFSLEGWKAEGGRRKGPRWMKMARSRPSLKACR